MPDPVDDQRQCRQGRRAVAAAVVEDHDRSWMHRGEHARCDLPGGRAGRPVGRVDRPEHDSLAERRGDVLDGRRRAAGGRPEEIGVHS